MTAAEAYWAERYRRANEERKQAREALATALERKGDAYRDLWKMQQYAGHLQIAVKALGSDAARYDDLAEVPAKLLDQALELTGRDLRWPLREEPDGDDGAPEPTTEAGPGGEETRGSGAHGSDQEGLEDGPESGGPVSTPFQLESVPGLWLWADPQGGLRGIWSPPNRTQGDTARERRAQVRMVRKDRQRSCCARSCARLADRIRDRLRGAAI